MKKIINRLLTGTLLAVFVLGVAFGQAYEIDESFTAVPPSGWTNSGAAQGTIAYDGDSKSLQFSGTESITTFVTTDPDRVSFWHAYTSASGKGTVTVQYREGTGGTWTDLVTVTPNKTTYGQSNTELDLSSGDVYFKLIGAVTRKEIVIDVFQVTQSIVPSTSSLTGFAYEPSNGPSAEQSFTVSGADLTANISITPPTNYEISTGTGAGFSATNPITLTQSSGTVTATTIYARLKSGLSVGSYNAQPITISSTGKIDKTVTCSGDVSEGIVLNTSSLSDFLYEPSNGPSAEQSFTVEGADLTANIILTPPTNYEISTGTGGAFSSENPITLTESGGTVAETTIYVRLKSGLSETSYNGETITISSTGKIDKTVTCSGDVSEGIVLNTSSLSDFTYVQGSGPSSEQSFTVSGQDLTADISITPPTNYEISTGTGGSFSATNPITLTESGGMVAETTIYVRLKSGLSEASFNGEDITISSTGKIDKTVTCSGDVVVLILNIKVFVEGGLW